MTRRAAASVAAPAPRSPAFLRFLARWDRDRDALARALAEVAGHPVEFSNREVPRGANPLFQLFDRDPLDAVVQRADGTSVLPYDPWTAWHHVVEERYLGPLKPPLHARIRLPYHAVPGALRMALYPFVAGKQDLDPESCPPSPAWPIEGRVDRFRARLFDGMVEDGESAGGRGRAEGGGTTGRGPWPGGRRYALVMTHDVDTKQGQRLAGPVLDEMVELGLKPCFFLVGKGYRWDDGLCRAIQACGGEIGLHGDTHDNRIAFEGPERVAKRLDSCRSIMERYGVRGFRAPSLLVSDTLYEAVGARFDWDSSVPDTDTHTLLGPRRGCGTLFPFRRAGTLVLPTTMPADDRLELLGYRGLDLIALLRRKWLHAREAGGVCHFLTHPEPHLFGRPVIRDLYRALLKEMLDAGDAWVATPSELADYWMSLEREGE